EYVEAGARELILHGVGGDTPGPLADHLPTRGGVRAMEDRLAPWLPGRLPEASGAPSTGLRLGSLEKPRAGQSRETIPVTARSPTTCGLDEECGPWKTGWHAGCSTGSPRNPARRSLI